MIVPPVVHPIGMGIDGRDSSAQLHAGASVPIIRVGAGVARPGDRHVVGIDHRAHGQRRTGKERGGVETVRQRPPVGTVAVEQSGLWRGAGLVVPDVQAGLLIHAALGDDLDTVHMPTEGQVVQILSLRRGEAERGDHQEQRYDGDTGVHLVHGNIPPGLVLRFTSRYPDL